MKLRFSLRTLFAATAVAALACYWTVRPRIVARQFQAAIEEGRYRDADAFFKDAKYPQLERLSSQHSELWVRFVNDRSTLQEQLKGVHHGNLIAEYQVKNAKKELTTLDMNFPVMFTFRGGFCSDPVIKVNLTRDTAAYYQRLSTFLSAASRR